MGLLSNEYYDEMAKKAQEQSVPQAPVAPRESTAVATTAPAGGIFTGGDFRGGPETMPGVKGTVIPGIRRADVLPDAPFRSMGDISPEKQAGRFGGAVGSQEYYAFKAEHPYQSFGPQQVLGSFGLKFPDMETWDKMSRFDQASHIALMSVGAAGNLLKNLPREIIKAPIRFGLSVGYQPWKAFSEGKVTGQGAEAIMSAAEDKPLTLPWLGEVPTYWKSYKDAKDSGLGDLAASVITGTAVLGDVTIAASLAEGISTGLRPRKAILEGEPIKNIEPIKSRVIQESGNGRVVPKAPSSAEYYSLPETVAKKSGGNSGNTFLKITPASEGNAEVAIVQVREGAIPRTKDYLKGVTGYPVKSYKGDFGREVKLESQIVPTAAKPAAAESVPLAPGVPKPPVAAAPVEDINSIIKAIPPRPLKGFEDVPVTAEQIGNISKVSQVNGIESGISDAVIRTLTGKSVQGDLTQAEYGEVIRTLARMNNLEKYVPEAGAVNIASQFGSPQRHWMRSFEQKTGVPIYSEVYVPMEDAFRVRNVFRSKYQNQAREIYGDYAGSKFGEERRLIKSYMEGDKSAITNNPKLTPEVKADLVKIADQMAPLYDELGDIFGIPREVFLKDYQPHIADLGGVYQLYKEGAPIPKELTFFAEFKRHGSLNVQVDDSLALFDIYTNTGSNKFFLNPALERVGKLAENLPSTIHNSVKSYVQEKMGYAGRIEEYLNKVGTNINKNLGTNLPPDIARQMTQLAMDTMYSGALANPGSVFRNALQYDLLGYPRLGPRFYVDAAKQALTKEGIAEVRSKGFLVDLGVPYGEELTKDITVMGKAGNMYRKGTQATLAPFSMADDVGRARVYFQTKFQFNDAVSRYNAGKITWEKLEKELDFGALSPVDQNIIRQRLIAGDQTGAFDHLVRDIIDDTQFPYRKGASSRLTYGIGGKLGTSFMQWPIEFGHTMGRWVKGNQWDKVIRYFGSGTMIVRTMKDALGLDFQKSVGLGPFSANLSPAVQAAQNTYDWMKGVFDDNAEQIEQSSDALLRTIKTLGIPAGGQIDRINSFRKSIQAYNDPKNPKRGPNGEYPVLDSRGRVSRWATFDDLWWTMWGFPTNERVENTNLQNDMRNAKFNYSQAKQKVLELYQQADSENPDDPKFKEANDLIEQYQISISPQDFDQYYVPLSQRTYDALPASLKAKFAPQVFK